MHCTRTNYTSHTYLVLLETLEQARKEVSFRRGSPIDSGCGGAAL